MTVPAQVLAARQTAELLYDAAAVSQAIDRLAVRLSVALAEENPLCLCVMNGGMLFTSALVQRMLIPMELSYVHVARYGEDTVGGAMNWYARPRTSLQGRHVVLLDDILDQGITLEALQRWTEDEGAVRTTTVVLLDKIIDGERPVDADFAALSCPDRYVFGWGMDFKGYWRNLPDIYAMTDTQ